MLNPPRRPQDSLHEPLILPRLPVHRPPSPVKEDKESEESHGYGRELFQGQHGRCEAFGSDGGKSPASMAAMAAMTSTGG
jgi:hypothetical protein